MTANGNAIRAGRAFVELFADNTALVRGLRAAKKELTAFGKEVREIGSRMFAGGAAVVTPLLAAAKAYASAGTDAAQAARRTGMTVEAFSALAFAAGQSDVKAGRLESGLRRMQKTLAAAADGSKSAKENLADLGLRVEDLASLRPEQQFALVADRIARIEDPAQRTAAALGIFGRGGAELIPLVAGGAAGIAKLTAEASRLGLVMSTEDAEAAESFGKALKKLWAVLRQAVSDIGSAVAPVLQGLARWLTEVTVNVSRWIRTHQELIRQVLVGAAIVAGFGAALVVVGVAVKIVAGVIGALVTVISVLHAVFGAVAAAMSFLLTPLGLVLANLAVFTAIAAKLGAFDRAIQSVKASLAALADETRTTFGAIAAAVKGGDILAAVKVLWSYVKMEWKAGTNWLTGIWDGFTFALRKAFSAAGFAILETGKVVWNAIQDGWDALIFVMCQAWNGFSTSIAVVWEEIKASAAKAWNYVRALWSDIDVGQANQAIEDQKNAAVAALENRSGQAYLDHEAENAARRKRREDELQAMIQADEQDSADLQREQDRRARERADELAKATREWRDAVAAARAAGSAADRKPVKKTAIPTSSQVRAAVEKLDVRGTFNSFALLGLSSANVALAERTADASEQTARNTDKIAREIEDLDGATFE